MNITLPRAVVQAALECVGNTHTLTELLIARNGLRTALAQPQASTPPECQTEDEKRAFAFGWYKALEYVRAQPATHLSEFSCPLCYDDPANIKQPAPVGEPVAFVIFDKQGEPHHVTAYRQAAHEHINDAIAEHGLTEASGWVVRPVYATPQPRKPLTDERIC